MTSLLVSSSRTVNSDLALVILAGALMVPVISDALAFVALAGSLLSFVLVIVLSGRIVSRVQKQSILPILEIIKYHWLNYLLVVLIIAAPVFLVKLIGQRAGLPLMQFLLVTQTLHVLISVVTIYVLPVVIAKQQKFVAIIVGVQYLYRNFSQSLPVVFIVLVGAAITVATFVGIYQIAGQGGNFTQVSLANWLSGIATTYISLLVFAMATTILFGREESTIEIET